MFGDSLDLPSEETEEPEAAEEVELVAGSEQLGPDKRGLVEGRITIGRLQIGPIPPADLTGPLAPDRRHWSMYALHVPFTLHELPGRRELSRLDFSVRATDERITAYDLFPDQVAGSVEKLVSFSLNPSLKFDRGPQAALGEVKRQVTSVTLVPEISSFGVGEPVFRWVHRAPLGRPGVVPGRKHALAVLQVPRGLREITLRLTWAATLRRPWLTSFLEVTATGTADRTEHLR